MLIHSQTVVHTVLSALTRSVLRALLGLGLAMATLLASAAPLQPGEPLPPLQTVDQHDKPWRLEPTSRVLLFAADKAGSDMVLEALQPLSADALSTRHAAFVADIHAMPSLVTRMFALPKLRDVPFAIGLGHEAALTARLPRTAKQVTLIRLHEGVVQGFQFVASPAELKQALASLSQQSLIPSLQR